MTLLALILNKLDNLYGGNLSPYLMVFYEQNFMYFRK